MMPTICAIRWDEDCGLICDTPQDDAELVSRRDPYLRSGLWSDEDLAMIMETDAAGLGFEVWCGELQIPP